MAEMPISAFRAGVHQDPLGRVLLVPRCITTAPSYLLWHGWPRGHPPSAPSLCGHLGQGDEVAVILLFRGAEPAGTAAEHRRARADVLREERSRPTRHATEASFREIAALDSTREVDSSLSSL